MQGVVVVPDIVIYHAPCSDGYGAAYVAWKYCQENNLDQPCFWPKTHTDKIDFDSLKDQAVLMVDIAFSPDVMDTIQTFSRSFVVLDHHKTAEEDLKDRKYATFDMNKSGVMLAWDYFFPDKEIPDFLRYIGLRDLWRHKDQGNEKALHFTTAFSAEADVAGNVNFVYWDLFFAYPVLVDAVCKDGEQRVEKLNEKVASLANQAQDMTWDTIKVKCYEIKPDEMMYISDLGNELTLNDPELVAFLWYQQEDGKYKISMRSTGFDVGTLAKKMGGGGHTRAAGFVTSKHPNEILQ